MTDGEEFFGVGLEPISKAIIGSQQVPFIYEDRLSEEQVVDALVKLYEMTREERTALGAKGRAWSQKQFNFDVYVQRWDELFTSIVEKNGSWDDRKNYSSYEVKVF